MGMSSLLQCNVMSIALGTRCSAACDPCKFSIQFITGMSQNYAFDFKIGLFREMYKITAVKNVIKGHLITCLLRILNKSQTLNAWL